MFVLAAEAIHIGSLIAAQGYIFPISDHVLTLKDDGTFYRFQVSLNIFHYQQRYESCGSPGSYSDSPDLVAKMLSCLKSPATL